MVKPLPETHVDVVALREAEKKLAALKKQKRQQETELEEKRNEYSRFVSLSKDEKLQQQADALLAEQPLSAVTRDDLERASRELEILKRAIEQQTRNVVLASRKPNDLLHKHNFEEHVRIQRRKTAAILELSAAEEEEHKFFEELRNAGATSIKFRRGSAFVGTLKDPQSPASFYCKEVAEFLPEALAS